MKNVIVVMDLQFGSTGKGQVSGLLAMYLKPDTVVCANGPNTGHTFCWNGHKFVSRALPSGSVAPSVRNILIGPGAVIDCAQILVEVKRLGEMGLLKDKNLGIHPNAPVLFDAHIAYEQEHLRRIGSTMKGTGEALVSKIRREPGTIFGSQRGSQEEISALVRAYGGYFQCSAQWYDRALDSSRLCIVEGSQGFSLGYHTEFYPYTTSRDNSLWQLLADCRLPARGCEKLKVIGVARTYPIRVANRFDADGNQVGTSGGHYSDQREIEWSEIGREPELTTVTQLPRRLFTFSTQQLIEAARIIEPDFVVLTHCDYLSPKPEVGAQIGDGLNRLGQKIYQATGAKMLGFGFGPTEVDMFAAASDIWPSVLL